MFNLPFFALLTLRARKCTGIIQAGEVSHAGSRVRPVTLRACLPIIMTNIKDYANATLLLVDEAVLRTIISEELANALTQVKDKPRRSYTRQEVCDMLHVSLMTLDGYIKRGDIKVSKIGRRVLIDADAIDEAIESGMVRKYKHTYGL